MLGFKSFDAAQSTLVGIERMHMLHKGQLADGIAQGLTATEQFHIPSDLVVDRWVSDVEGSSVLDFPFIHDA
jgi:hypothetical protein